MERAISQRSEFLANVTNVAFILGPSAVAGGRPAWVFGVVPERILSASVAGFVPAFDGTPTPLLRMSAGFTNRCVEEEEMK